ncbi:cell division regulator GpsB [Bacillus fonticola]|uniref:cell division regulator GpsB n=1 Tax=Bacillus fonticola TaxID=2728853 RepID=UPI00147677BC|nr:cell division regulator GpsB [Bacillus fonticola]
MYTERIKLTAKEILEKDFKSGMRGYKPEDVDQFLDLIIKDYEAFHEMIDELQQENSRLKKQADQATQQRTKTTTTAQPAGTTNFDILKRLSNLEKHVFGSKLYE